MQHELQNGCAVLYEGFFESVDLLVALIEGLLGCELADAANQHILVVRAIENADETAARTSDMGTPQEIVRQFRRARSAE